LLLREMMPDLPFEEPVPLDAGRAGTDASAKSPSGTAIGAKRSGRINDDTLHMLVDAVTDYAIFLLSPEGIITSWNKGARRIKGYTADEIIGSHFSIFYGEDLVAQGWPAEELRRARQEGRFEDENWRLRKDGSRFWANVVITALRAPDGELVGYAKITRDLTERRKHEEELRQSEESFRLLVEGARDHAIFLLDRDGHIVNWNGGAARVMGFSVEEALGHHFAMFFPPEDVAEDKPQHALAVAAASGFSEEIGWRLKRDGSRFWADVGVTALRERDGSLRGFAIVTRDLSERRRVEALESEGKRMNEFIAMLGHELRNPLAPIRNAVGIMEKKATSPEMLWCKDVISRQVGHLARFVDDLLDVSRITSGKIQLEKELIEMNGFVSSSIESVRSAASTYGHTLELTLSDHDVQIIGDPTRLSQVIVNLINNAAKYTPDGGHIRVDLEQRGGCAYIRIRDNGIGMSHELLDTAFDLFVQGDRTLDRPEGGLGIGLTLVKRIVELHGGAVSATSAGEGNGSEFVVSLPAVENNVAAVRRQKAPPQRMTPRRVLVVDDNVDAANSLSALLEMSGHLVSVTHSGAEALHQATVHAPDVVLLDIGLPGMNGYEVARRLRELPGMKTTRLIAITGYGQESDKRAAIEAGFDTHLVKPVDYQLLADILEEDSR
jgi:PAS domain S-box-containing protein